MKLNIIQDSEVSVGENEVMEISEIQSDRQICSHWLT